MSTNRVSADRGWVDGTNREPVCRRCGGQVPKGRRTFCGKTCVHEHRIRTDPGYVRLKVFERDRGVCASCGVDTMAEIPERHRKSRGSGHLWQADHIVPVVEGGGECGLEYYRTLCTACHKAETARLIRRLRGVPTEGVQEELFGGDGA